MRASLAVLALSMAAAGACRSKSPPTTESVAGPSEAARAVPVDHLAEGELVEGKEKIFSLTLPRDLKLVWKFPDRGMARGEIDPERVANYVRARVKDGKITAGASQTMFDGVHTLAEPLRPLRIRIEKAHGYCQMEVTDVTLPPDPDPGADEATRWRRLGLTPNGQPLDPKHLE